MNVRKILPVIAMLGLLMLGISVVGAQDATAQPQAEQGSQQGQFARSSTLSLMKRASNPVTSWGSYAMASN